MARERTSEEILDQLVFVVACVARHYGPGLSSEGLTEVRQKLASMADCWYCDSSWRVDTLENDDLCPDFCPYVLPVDFLDITFEDVSEQSKIGQQPTKGDE